MAAQIETEDIEAMKYILTKTDLPVGTTTILNELLAFEQILCTTTVKQSCIRIKEKKNEKSRVNFSLRQH